jgi:hypothetical protein
LEDLLGGLPVRADAEYIPEEGEPMVSVQLF